MRTISLLVTHKSLPDDLIHGFRFTWAFYVSGFRSSLHCQPCLKGKRHPEFFTGNARSGRVYELDDMDRFEYVYICGVGSGPKAERSWKNLHMPLRYAPGRSVARETYNGYTFTATNAAAVPIPPLPDGWNGRDPETTRCKNFQFAVAYFGLQNLACRVGHAETEPGA